jgi:hypothetical protein
MNEHIHDLSDFLTYDRDKTGGSGWSSPMPVPERIDLLVQLVLFCVVLNMTPTRYQFNPENDVAQAVIQLDGAIHAAWSYAEEA